MVVPTFRRPAGLRRLVTALDGQSLDRGSWELIVVDDGSGPGWSDQIDAIVAASKGPARVVHAPSNRGPAVARNLGWRDTDADVVAFTDDDCWPEESWLESGLAAIEADTTVGIVQGPTIRPPGSDSYPYSYLTVVREVLEPSPWFEGCNLFLRRTALDATGGFDESLVVHGEETALGWSALHDGWERAWAAQAVIFHEVVDRPWRWHLKTHFLERHLVLIAGRYPEIRGSFWRPWAVKRENALFGLAVIGIAASRPRASYRSLAALALPYVLWLMPPWRRPPRPVAAIHQVSVHAASLAGKITAWIPARTFLL